MTGSWRSSWSSRCMWRILHREKSKKFSSSNLFLGVFTENTHMDGQWLSLLDMQWCHKDSWFYSASNIWSLNQLWHLSLAHLARKKVGGKTQQQGDDSMSWHSHLMFLEDVLCSRIIIPSTSQKSTTDLLKRINPLMTLSLWTWTLWKACVQR